MAYALLIASVNFGVTSYYTEGIAVANAMFNNSVKSNTLVPFPPFTPNPRMLSSSSIQSSMFNFFSNAVSILNPSYFAPGYYDMFNARDTTGSKFSSLLLFIFESLTEIQNTRQSLGSPPILFLHCVD